MFLLCLCLLLQWFCDFNMPNSYTFTMTNPMAHTQQQQLSSDLLHYRDSIYIISLGFHFFFFGIFCLSCSLFRFKSWNKRFDRSKSRTTAMSLFGTSRTLKYWDVIQSILVGSLTTIDGLTCAIAQAHNFHFMLNEIVLKLNCTVAPNQETKSKCERNFDYYY